MIIANLKTKQTLRKKKDKLESLKNKYFHKLNFYLNQTTTNQTFIIHLSYITLPLSHLYNNSYHTHTKTLDSLFLEDSCIELDLEDCIYHISFICFD